MNVCGTTKLSSTHKISNFFSSRRTEGDSILISWIRNNLMHEHRRKKERKKDEGREPAPKGACNYSQGCIARKSKGKVHEATTRVESGSVCAAIRGQRNGGKREGARVYMCVRPCASVSVRGGGEGAACVIQKKRESRQSRACERKHKGE